MKKRFILILAAVIVSASFTACGNSSSDSKPASSTGSSVSDSAEDSSPEQAEETSAENTQESSKQAESASESPTSGSGRNSDSSKTENSKQSSASSNSSSKIESQTSKNSDKPENSSSSKPNSSTTETSSENSKTNNSTSDNSSTANQESSKTSSTKQETSKPSSTKQETSKPSSTKQEISKPSSTKQETSKPDSSDNNGNNNNTDDNKQNNSTEKTTVSAEIGDISVYNQLFDLSSKVTVQITMSKAEMDKMDSDYYKYDSIKSKSPIYRKCDVSITVGGKTYNIDEVGIRPKGNMSLEPVYDSKSGKLNLSHYKLSFCETFDDKTYYGSDAKIWTADAKKARKNRRFATLKKLDVKWNRNFDDTYIREIYAARMFRQSGVLAQNIGLSQITFNGSNYGVFTIYEPVDKVFLERYLPEEALGGDLYKVGWTNSPANYVKNQVTIGVADEDKAKKYNFNLKTNEKKSTNARLNNLLTVINQKMTAQQLEEVVDTDYFCKFLAAYYFAGDPDDIRNNYNNHYIYFRKDNGKAIFIPYDNDRTLGITMGYNPDGTGMTAQSPYSEKAAGINQNQANPLIKEAIKSNGLLRDKYTAALKKTAALPLWNTSAFEAEYNKAKNTYEKYITPDVSFANVKKSFKFSLDGKFSKGKKTNMSFSDFVTRIMKTYNQYIS